MTIDTLSEAIFAVIRRRRTAPRWRWWHRHRLKIAAAVMVAEQGFVDKARGRA